MMTCDICHTDQGPFEVAEVTRYYDMNPHVALKLVCEDCGIKLREERRLKENASTNVCNKRHGR